MGSPGIAVALANGVHEPELLDPFDLKVDAEASAQEVRCLAALAAILGRASTQET